jgi:hypothetical protein
MGWKIYYGDGSTFSSDDGTPYDAPKQDVQVIAITSPTTGVEFEQGQDYFVYESERVTSGFTGTDIFGMFDHLLRSKQQCVFFGRHMLNEEFWAFYKSVKAQYPHKSALTKKEMRCGLKL